MALTDAQIEHFRTLYSKRFGTEIDRQTAEAFGVSLVELMKRVHQPLTEERLNQVKK